MYIVIGVTMCDLGVTTGALLSSHCSLWGAAHVICWSVFRAETL